MTDAGATPLLAFEHARWLAEGPTERPELHAEVSARRLTLLGDWSSLFRLLSGAAKLDSGAVRVLGVPAQLAVLRNVVGLSLPDMPLPGTWTVEGYLQRSADLLGKNRRAAKLLARETLRRFGLEALAGRRLSTLQEPERRVFSLVHATLAEPAVLCCEAPLARLDAPAVTYVGQVLEQAIAGRSAIVSITSTDPAAGERWLLDRSDAVLAVARGHIVDNTSPSELLARGARVLATVTRHVQAFRSALTERGLTHSELGRVDALHNALPVSAEVETARFLVTLRGAGDTAPLVQAALQADAPLVELVPIEG
jgi:ABC-type multidrug transport system ATPase subunit